VKIDVGCGSKVKDGFLGVDIIRFPGVEYVCDVRKGLPFENDSVDEIWCQNFLEHLTNLDGKFERVALFNEFYRVLKPGAKATVIIPHWSASRFYGDPTHCEPFSEFGFYYLSQAWRDAEAPATDAKHVPWGYRCNFEATWGYALHPALAARHSEHQQYATTWFKEACQEIHATLIKR